MKKIFKKFERWFDLRLGWFFVSGQEWKQERHRQYLIKKYPEDYKRSQEKESTLK